MPRLVLSDDAVDLLLAMKTQQDDLQTHFQSFSRTLQEVQEGIGRLEKGIAPPPVSNHMSVPSMIGASHPAMSGVASEPEQGRTVSTTRRHPSVQFSQDSSNLPVELGPQAHGRHSHNNVTTALGSIGTDEARTIMRGADSALRVISADLHAGNMAPQAESVNLPQRKWRKAGIASASRFSHDSFASMQEGLLAFHWVWKFADSAWFGWLCGMIIIADAVMIAIETDDLARTGEEAPGYTVSGYLFSSWYVVELMLRILASKPHIRFFTGKEQYWNLFDILLISASALDIVIQRLESVRLRAVAIGRVFRALRLFRIIRVLRIIRFMTFLREFHKLVLCLASSLQTLVCAISLVTFVIFCFSVLFVQLVAQHLETGPDFVPQTPEEEELIRAFGTVGRSMVSLYMAITAGRNWGELADLLLWVSPALRACFFVYLALAIFGLTNVVTAVFVESAMQATQNYRDLLVQEMMLKDRANVKHMRQIFKSIDTDNSGAISLNEMHEFMQDETLRLQEYFEALDLSASDTQTLFQLLDVDGNGEVDIDEFCDGCMRLGGSAKSFDMNCMWYEQRRTNAEMLKFIQHACICLHLLSKSVNMPEKAQRELMRATSQLLHNSHNSRGTRRSSRSTNSSRTESGPATTATLLSSIAFGNPPSPNGDISPPPSVINPVGARPGGSPADTVEFDRRLLRRRSLSSNGLSELATGSCLSTEFTHLSTMHEEQGGKPELGHFSYQC